MTSPIYEPTAVLDIVSFGFRKLFRSLFPLTKLTLPFIITVSIIMGLIYPDIMRLQSYETGSDVQALENIPVIMLVAGASILTYFIMLYAMYVIFRYVLDLYQDKTLENLYSYWVPERRLWGLMGLSFIFIVASIPMTIIMIIGFIMFVIPGVIILLALMYVGIRVCMCWYAYMVKPDDGLFEAIIRSWKLTAGNFWRTMGLFFITWIIQILITMPFSLISGINNFIAGLNPSYTDSYIFIIIMIVLFAISYCVQLIIATGGSFFVDYRYYFDLEARGMAKTASLNIIPSQQDGDTQPPSQHLQ